MSEYPKQMHHPAYSPGTSGRQASTDASGELGELPRGQPCRFPPVVVTTQDDEDQYRAKGYLAEGEKPSGVDGYHEYPKMLIHPDHVPEVPPEVVGYRETESGPILTRTLPGKPAILPAVTVNSRDEEMAWNLKGYQMPRLPDPQAVQRAKASVDLDYAPRADAANLAGAVQEYPKWVKSGKTVDGQEEALLVHNADEELAMLGDAGMTKGRIEALIAERRTASERGDEATIERVEKLLADNGIEVKDRPHGTVWRRIEQTAAGAEVTADMVPGPTDDQLSTWIADGGGREDVIAELTRRGTSFSKSTPTKHLRALLNEQATA